jgi:hypothetical protein
VSLTELVNPPWWIWIVAALAAAAIGAAAVYFRRNRALEGTIRRELARKELIAGRSEANGWSA